MSFVMGSVHAYSIFLVPLETRFEIGRSTASLPYSVALVAISLAVLGGPKIYAAVAPQKLLIIAAVSGAAGLVGAAASSNIVLFVLSFGVIFGLSNGVGYGYGLQLAARNLPGKEGLAMGSATAAYALGAATASLPLAALTDAFNASVALIALAAVLLATGPAIWVLLQPGCVQVAARATTGTQQRVVVLWLGYTSAVAAGLMAIGHASTIATSAGVTAAWLAPSLIAVGNLLGSFGGGALGDKLRISWLLAFLAVATATGLAIAATGASAIFVLAALALIGMCYGATISLFPALIAKRFGPEKGPSIYGRVFTGWGLMGLCAPWIAGALFDQTGSYQTPLFVAAALAIVSAFICLRLDRD